MSSTSQKRITPDALFQNPSAKGVLGLLGVGDFEFSNRTGLRLGSLDARKLARTPQGSSTSAFGPESMARISNFIQGGNRNRFQDIDAPAVAEGVRPALDASNEFFANTTAPALQELVDTGFRSDTDALRQSAQHSFRSETLPEAFERLSAFGSGLASSGAQNTVGRLAADLEAELFGFEFAADEAANQRRAGAVPLAQTMFDENTLKQLSVADLLQQFGRSQEAGSAEAGMLQSLMALSGLGGSINNPQPMIFGRQPSDLQNAAGVVNGMMGTIGGMTTSI